MKMRIPCYQRRDYFKLRLPKKEKRDMRIGSKNDNRVIVTVKTATRDNKTGKITYETFDSLDVFEAGPEEVVKAVVNGLTSAARTK
jgi:hypothetical protein